MKMSRFGGMIRDEEGLRKTVEETEQMLSRFPAELKKLTVQQAALFYHLRDMLLAQKVYLSAMYDYILRGGGSRGSALYSCKDGEKPDAALPDLYRCKLDQGRHGAVIQETAFENGECQVSWRPVREIPTLDYFFETQWKRYRERYGLS